MGPRRSSASNPCLTDIRTEYAYLVCMCKALAAGRHNGRMMVGLLGPFEITAGDGGPVELPGRKPRGLAAVLACHANRWVSSGVLVEALWGSSPPQRVDVSLRVYVHHLRKALGSERIGRRPEGYILRLDPDELDADRFAALVEAGRRAAGAGERERA